MSWIKKLGKVTGKIAGAAVGAATGFVVGGPGGAVVGAKLGYDGTKKLISSTGGGGGGGGEVQLPGVPTIDTAAQNQQVADRIKRRRGVLANLYGGGATSSPMVATKQLLGS